MSTPVRRRTTPAQEAWELVWRIFTEDKARRMAMLDELGLAPMQAHALQVLTAPMSMSTLATLLVCDNSNVTGIVDRLEAQGLVERRPSTTDRRVKELVVTPKGEKVREEVHRRMSVPPPQIAALGAADARALRDVLRRAVRPD